MKKIVLFAKYISMLLILFTIFSYVSPKNNNVFAIDCRDIDCESGSYCIYRNGQYRCVSDDITRFPTATPVPGNSPPTGTLRCTSQIVLGQSGSFTLNGSDVNGNLSLAGLYYSSTASQHWYGNDNSDCNTSPYCPVRTNCTGASCSLIRTWTPPAVGQYYVTANYYDSAGGACSGNPYITTFPYSGFYACANPLSNDYCTVNVVAAPRPDYCKTASVDKATMSADETLTLSSESNTPVNGFFYLASNLDNPSNTKTVCTGAGAVTATCPNGGTPFTLSDPNNKTDGTGLRQIGSVQISFGRLFLVDKSTGQQVKNIQLNAYFSLNGGQWSWPKENCVTYTRMVVTTPTLTPIPLTETPIPPTATPAPGCTKKSQGDADCDDIVNLKDYFYYVQKTSGGNVSTSVSVDFNVSGTLDGVDRGIIIHTLLGQ